MPQQIEAFLGEELKILEDMVEKIVGVGANVVIVKKGCSVNRCYSPVSSC
jgi:chaperonin GroEL (HSP60 family)